MEIQIQSAEELLSGTAVISMCVEEIERVKKICEERQKEIEQEEGQLEEQSATWRVETLEPLRETLREVNSLSQLLDAYNTIDNHAARREEAEVAQAALRNRLDQAKFLKGMLHSMERELTVSQQENASQRIDAALPQINEIFRNVCGNPQYDRLQVDCSIKNGSIVYSFRTLPEQRALGDVAAGVLSGGNQAVASIAVLMALAAGDTHQFPTLVLDDPCVQMDPATIERWAVAAAEFAQNQQLIVLTHQPDVADHLEANGAFREDLNGWDQGILPGRGEE
jgi:DNA repair exonuclease SbcCD ATPase subunit